ncbi:hypothetical protein RHGRI_011214 [Rhododendron griersonianum]|uniref:Uncharacterized protein n=1 Tax=Rhododendron griersonianum TaxID=479676 RepID=A0AAV6KL91_9ERIC|nr:hypothetical protein RHGRI_011214 [Rhododendron griersonianum]
MLGRADSQFLIYSQHSANTILNPWFQPLLDVAVAVGPNVELPTSTRCLKSTYLKSLR